MEKQSSEYRQESPRTLAEKLDHLFEVVQKPGGGPYSHHDVAVAIEAAGGPTISATYIWQLRRGLRDNPTINHLDALAKFFGVSIVYLIDDSKTEEIESQLPLLAAMRDSGAQALALRAEGMSAEAIQAITAMMDHIRKTEGLPARTVAVGARGRRAHN